MHNESLPYLLRLLLLGSVSVVLSACLSPPPEPALPPLPGVTPSQLFTAAPQDWPSAQWWKQWNNVDLNRLVSAAQAHNPDLDSAQARLEQAAAVVSQAHGSLGANVSAMASVDHERLSANSYIPPPYGGKVYDDGELGLQMQWDIDLWGQRRALLKAAVGERRARALELQGMADWLSTQVAAAYVRYQFFLLQQQQVVQQQTVEKAIVQRLQLRVQQGLEPAEHLQEPELDQMASVQENQDILGQLAQEQVQLQTLTQLPWSALKLPPVALPVIHSGIPPKIALDWVSRRADLAAARARVEAATARVHAAHQAFYPDVNLAAMLGYSSLGLNKLVAGGSAVAGISPAIHLPLFDAGRLKADMQQGESAAQLAVADYQKTLAQAVTEVNRALVGMASMQRQQQVLQSRTQQLQRQQQEVEQRVIAGLDDPLPLLRLQQRLILLHRQGLNLQRQALLDQVALVQALGGGFTDDTGLNTARSAIIHHD